ncbi:hypothetical protein LF1_53460 [Rubripirellula obstinata]|uniref:Uncharacterized protein n=1 Tax=Rubripirellula obstinata TaxID=406547 RepID=A0A5B1C8Q6_9BACT|nr:hypothetical protein LF1_53460 [Rubripirellula obstinata]
MNARTLGIALALGWLALPLAACAGAIFMLDDELSPMSVAVAAALSLPFIVGTTLYVYIACKRCIALPHNRLLPRLIFALPLIGLAGWATFLNTTPRRITPDTVSDSPIDKYWYSAPQTAYGSPFPYLRYFDDPIPDRGYPEIGGSLLDYTAVFGNLTLWAFCVFVLVSLAYTLLPPADGG